MDDQACVRFLQWALPRLRMEWSGFRKVRRQVSKRLQRRLRQLGLDDTSAYRSYLASHPDEWIRLDSFCRITISRFYRDRNFWGFMGESVLPDLTRLVQLRGEREIRCWCAGAASGEEPYTLNILWKLHPARDIPLRILATDIDDHLIDRARRAQYSRSSLRDLPEEWLETAFARYGDLFTLRPRFREGVEFVKQDIRLERPHGPFHLILCRNLVLTYFDQGLQREVLSRMVAPLVPGGVLVVGKRESIPESSASLETVRGDLGVYRRSE